MDGWMVMVLNYVTSKPIFDEQGDKILTFKNSSSFTDLLIEKSYYP